jgi:hypothetical protein
MVLLSGPPHPNPLPPTGGEGEDSTEDPRSSRNGVEAVSADEKRGNSEALVANQGGHCRRTEVEDEIAAVAHAGEMPEVARAEAVFYLTEDPEGPGLHLTSDELAALDQAVIQAYARLLRRDLNVRTVGRRAWRGLNRGAANLGRLASYIDRRGLAWPPDWPWDLASLLEIFLSHEQAALDAGRAYTLIPPGDDLPRLARGLGLDPAAWPDLIAAARTRPWLDFGEVWWLGRVGAMSGERVIRIESTDRGAEIMAQTPDGDSVRLACWWSGEFDDALARAELLAELAGE